MTTTTIQPTTRQLPFDLEDIAAELTGISRTLTCIAELVMPRRIDGISTPTESTIEGAFFAIERQIDRIADNLNDFDDALMKMKTATPTDESKDCR